MAAFLPFGYDAVRLGARRRGFWGAFARVAALALEDRPQFREGVGLRERS